jgi:hypothetical protein
MPHPTPSLPLICWYGLQALFFLFAAHSVCDYALQGDFMARVKDQRSGSGIPWAWPLTSHAAIQALGVFLVTSSPVFAAFELAAHWVIDYNKSAGRYGFGIDQSLHVACKVLIVVVWFYCSLHHVWPYNGHTYTTGTLSGW